jgi:hypothetical protein
MIPLSHHRSEAAEMSKKNGAASVESGEVPQNRDVS